MSSYLICVKKVLEIVHKILREIWETKMKENEKKILKYQKGTEKSSRLNIGEKYVHIRAWGSCF